MPYGGTFAKQQCELTGQWLQEHEGEHLDFAREQALINFAHGATDRAILAGIKGTSLGHKEKIERLWLGEGDRGDAARLIRDISSVSLVVHGDPDQLLHAPFGAESFSLHPGTMKAAFEGWQLAKEDTFEQEGLAWTICYLQEREADEDAAQANRPIRYEWIPIRDKAEISPPLLAVHPSLVSYSPERGLTLYPVVGHSYECAVPERHEAGSFRRHTYQLESYATHIRHVYDVFEEEWEGVVTAIGHMLEKRFNWPEGVVLEAARLTVLLHDVGKLRQGWQTWAQAYHQAIGEAMPEGFVAAHTLSQTDEHREKERGIRPKRPHHAVESAVATHKIFRDRFPDIEPLRRAAFTAICRHHTPSAKETESYQLIVDYAAQIDQTLSWLSQPLVMGSAVSTLKATQRTQENIMEKFLVRPYRPADMSCYMLLVRALRFSDQAGTARGSGGIR
jgi:hypothetical protein